MSHPDLAYHLLYDDEPVAFEPCDCEECVFTDTDALQKAESQADLTEHPRREESR